MAKTARITTPAGNEKRESLSVIQTGEARPLTTRDNIRLINEEHELVVTAVVASAERLREGIDLAIRIGQRLAIERPRVPAQEWNFWLEVNCPKISRWTADRYMRLAGKAHVLQATPQLQTLRQAYLLAGIIKPAIPHGQFQPLASVAPEAAVQIEMVSLYFHRWENTVFRKHIGTADREQLEYWRDYLKPAAEAYSEVSARLAAQS